MNTPFSASAPEIPRFRRKGKLTGKFHKLGGTLRKAFKSQESIEETFEPSKKPIKKSYITIYNLTQGECLTYNRFRGFTRDEIDWKAIRECLTWNPGDVIWAISKDGTEYVCTAWDDLPLAKNPRFYLSESFMRPRVLALHASNDYKELSFYDLLRAAKEEEHIGPPTWWIKYDPDTGKVIDVT